MSCEGDLTTADLDEANTSTHTLSRVTGGSLNSQNLYPYINHRNCHGLNLQEPSDLVKILRPHHEKDSTELAMTNLDEDDGIIINVPFSENVRVKQIMISVPPSGNRPHRCRVWVNRPDGIGLEEVDEVQTEQDFELLEGESGAIDYPVKIARFSSVSQLTLCFTGHASSNFELFYLGFKGEGLVYNRKDAERTAIGAHNAADSFVDGVTEKYGSSQTTIR